MARAITLIRSDSLSGHQSLRDEVDAATGVVVVAGNAHQRPCLAVPTGQVQGVPEHQDYLQKYPEGYSN
ncbi:hypothetical protein AB0L35_10450 [Streptomyces sp. NPDC052309]|uniref:hypothetical protein n=1 Tax=Streptomyces sp. NPDC052309 TaxID=3155421 RepID=UPI00343C0691